MRSADHYSIGIDPGVNGGIAILLPERTIWASTKMPESELGIWIWLRHSLGKLKEYNVGIDDNWKLKACIEKVGGYIPRDRSGKDGKDSGDRGSHMHVFGQNYGACRMSLVALDLYPFLEPVPRVWQKRIGISPREEGEDDTSFKNRLKDRAIKLFPNDKITLSTCDAILLAYYCSMT